MPVIFPVEVNVKYQVFITQYCFRRSKLVSSATVFSGPDREFACRSIQLALTRLNPGNDQYRFIINYTLGCMLVQLNGGFEQLCYTMLYPNTVTEVAQACVSNILSSRRSRHSFIPPYLMSEQKREIVSSRFSAQGIVSMSSAVSSLCR